MKIDFNATKNVENNLEYIKSFKVILCGAVIYWLGVCGNGTPFKSFKFYSEIILRPFDIRYLREFTGSVLGFTLMTLQHVLAATHLTFPSLFSLIFNDSVCSVIVAFRQLLELIWASRKALKFLFLFYDIFLVQFVEIKCIRYVLCASP